MKQKFYPVERQFLGYIKYNIRHPYKLMAIRTGEIRPPKKGEYYLSGAIPEAYKSPNDLSTPFHIAKLVKVKEVKYFEIVEEI